MGQVGERFCFHDSIGIEFLQLKIGDFQNWTKADIAVGHHG